MLPWADQHLCQPSLPGSAPSASAANSPARTAEDSPLPDAPPTTPSSGAPASLATISATRRSRPKNSSASTAHVEGRQPPERADGHRIPARGRAHQRGAAIVQLGKVGHVRGQPGLEPAQLAATCRRLAGFVADSLGGFAARPGGVRDDQLESLVLAQDRFVHTSQLGTGLDPDLIHQDLARGSVGVERRGLPSRAVQREHPQCVETLAHRVLSDERLEPADQLQVAAGPQLALDREFDRREVQLLQASCLRGRERLVQ